MTSRVPPTVLTMAATARIHNGVVSVGEAPTGAVRSTATSGPVPPLGCDRPGDLDEAARAPSPPWRSGDMGRSAGRAQAPSGQYSGRCQDVNLIWCWEWRLVAGGVCRPPGLVESIGAALAPLPGG